MNPAPLVLSDIADHRAYEREREEFRREVIAVKKLRRVRLGPVVTLLFESRLTVRFQIQEMARAEKLTSDAQIQRELDVYNQLLPRPGELSATLFLELTTEEDLRMWLPRLVGIERSIVLEMGEGIGGHLVHSEPEATHESQLTRSGATSAVHYVRFRCNSDDLAAFHAGPVRLAVDHPEYAGGRSGVVLSEDTRSELFKDLTDG